MNPYFNAIGSLAQTIVGRRVGRNGFSLVLCLWACLACTETTQLRLDIVGDFQVPDEIERLVIEFRGDEVTFQTSHELRTPRRPLFESLILYPGSVLNGSVEIHVRAQNGERQVASSTNSVEFVPKQSRSIELRLQPDDEDQPIWQDEDEEFLLNGNRNLLYVRWLEREHDVP